MSSSDYLRTKLAAMQRVVSVQKPTDSSAYTGKLRMAAARQGFFIDGTSKGSLRNNTDDAPMYGNNPHAPVSSFKSSAGEIPLSSDRTTFAGSTAAWYDIQAQNAGGKKNLLCVNPTSTISPPSFSYSSGSDHTRILASSCLTKTGGVTDSPGDPTFVDNTIRLSAGVESKVTGCCGPQIEDANHTHSPGLPLNKQVEAIGKPFYIAPNPQPNNVARKQGGGYLGPQVGYVENKQGFVEPTRPIPKAPGPQGQRKAVLRINDPTFFSKI
uniref:Uncharacterized protein n=1 Tax=viral metagenome TaxID=1070528 RepID=A0A6C0JNZ8_9ZZZZ